MNNETHLEQRQLKLLHATLQLHPRSVSCSKLHPQLDDDKKREWDFFTLQKREKIIETSIGFTVMYSNVSILSIKPFECVNCDEKKKTINKWFMMKCLREEREATMCYH